MMGSGGLAQHARSDWIHPPARPRGRWLDSLLLVMVSLPALHACRREEPMARQAAASTAASSRPSKLASSPAERKPVVSVGQVARRDAYTARVRRVVECEGKEQSRPTASQLFLGVELEVQAGAPASVAVGHSHARLVDGHGSRYSAMPLVRTKNCDPLFKYKRLAPGQTARGWLVFAIPARAHSLTLELNPRRYLNESATLFRLDR